MTKRMLQGGCRQNRPTMWAPSNRLFVFLVAALLLLTGSTEGFSLSMMSGTPTTTTMSHQASSSSDKGVAIIAGATGYIGRSVVRESVRQGYHTVALVRDIQKVKSSEIYAKFFQGAQVVECDVSDPNLVLEVRTR